MGEGQVPVVYNTELQQTRDVLKEVAAHFKVEDIKLTFLIVNKSINMRFYQRQNGGQYVNPNPGTVVDKVCTRQER